MSDQEAALDRDHLDACTDGDRGLQKEVLLLFAEQAPRYIAALAQELADDEAWRRTAHRLKGAARAVGARRLADRAASAELAPAAERTDRLGALEAEWLRVEEAIRLF